MIARGRLAELRLPSPRAEDFGADVFRALEGFGKQLGKVAAAREEEARKQQQAIDEKLERAKEVNYQSKALTDFREHVDVESDRLKQESEVGAEGFAKAYSKSLERKRLEIEKLAPTSDSRNVTRAQLGGIFDRAMINARYFERTETVKKFGVDLKNNLELDINAIIRDPTSLQERMTNGFTSIARARESFLSAEKAAEIKEEFRERAWTVHIESRIGDDQEVDRVKAELDSGQFDAVLSPEKIRGLRASVDRALHRLERREEAEVKEHDRQIVSLLNDYKASKIRSYDWRGPNGETEELLAIFVAGTKHEASFQEIMQSGEVLGKFNQLTLIQQEQVLRGMRSGAKTGFEAKFLSTLERAHEANKLALEDDPLRHANRLGIIPTLPPLNLNDRGSLLERSRLAGIAEQALGVPVPPLTDVEADQLATMLESAPADQRVMVFRSLNAGFEGRQIRSVAAQLTKKGDKVLALTMGLSTEAPIVASGILRGKDILKDNPKIGLFGSELRIADDLIHEHFGEAYLKDFTGTEQAARRNAAIALYAYKSWQERDLSGVLDSRRMEEAVKEVTGGLLTISRGFLRGSYTIQPPRRGMTEDEFEEVLKRVDYSDVQLFSAEDIQNYSIFESVGEGKYLVKIGSQYVQGSQGPFILDLSDMGDRPIEDKAEPVGAEGIFNLPIAAP